MCPAPWRAPIPALVPGDNCQVKARVFPSHPESFTIIAVLPVKGKIEGFTFLLFGDAVAVSVRLPGGEGRCPSL